MKAIIIAIGDELISGKTVDTNSAYLADELTRRGIETAEHLTVGDGEPAICAALLKASAAADIVLVTGGLGPTKDDLTRQAMARAMGCELVVDEPSLRKIESFFARRNRVMVPANNIQAMLPAGAEAIDNEMGTAPGIAATLNDAMIFVMPGVPYEMKAMFESVIAGLLPKVARVITQRIIHTFGGGESDVASRIGDLMTHRDGPETVGTTVSAGLVSIRITVRADDEDSARARSDAIVADVRGRLGEIVIGEDGDTPAGVVGHLLQQAGQTLATAESCTGGMIGRLITDVPGASEYYLGGVVAYANAVKQQMLSVATDVLETEGAVSEPVARAMADGCRKHFGADWAISTTGIAGPGGGTEDKPVGLVYIAISGPGGCSVNHHVFARTRELIRSRAALTALNHLRLALINSAT